MRSQRTDRQISSEAAALLDLLRDVRDELRYLRQELRDSTRQSGPRAGLEADELLTVEQVAGELQEPAPPGGAGGDLRRAAALCSRGNLVRARR